MPNRRAMEERTSVRSNRSPSMAEECTSSSEREESVRSSCISRHIAPAKAESRACRSCTWRKGVSVASVS